MDAERTLPILIEYPFRPGESDGFASLGFRELVTASAEAPHVLGGQSDTESWVEQLASDLIFPTQAQIELAAQLAQKDCAAGFRCCAED
jgi:hypothetical protein